MPKKVFELAKEIGIGAIDLVDKLKGIGLDVRNHMVVLSDEDVSKAMEALSPKAAEPVKKKVVRKKKVVKKVATAKDGIEAAPAKEAEDKPKTKKVVTRKKKTIQKAAATPDSESNVEETVSSEAISATAPVVENTIDDSPAISGLQIIKQAEPKVVEEVAVAAPTPAAVVEKKEDGVFKEKMHTFTPIFTPEKKAEPKKEPAKPDINKAAGAVAGAVDANGVQKKRLGDLAAIVSSKGVVNRAKDMTQIRSEEQLKFASTVMGRVLYTPSKRKRIYSGAKRATELTEVKGSKRVINIFNVVTASDLADKLSQKFKSLANMCLSLNLLIKADDFIGLELATEISALYEYRVENKAFDEEKLIGAEVVEDKSSLPLRNPMIAVMGHVDHGKTTLLDQIRKTKVTDGEAGGITQHIGSYSVKVDDSTLTFLDTPGHAAFGSMRQRGAKVTDIVILVVAADDGVMPQTKQSIKFAKNAGTPIIVAINKMDKEGANPEKVKQELTEFELVSEEWGGDTMFVPVSALEGEGIDDLLEAVKLTSEILELRADPKGKAEGVVIESRIESGRGPVATVLVQKGTLKKGDSLVIGECYGRARTLMNDSGKDINSAGPSIPVQVLGLNAAPSPGATLNVVKNEREARKIVDNRISERKNLENIEAPKVASLEDFFANADVETGQKKILNLIIRSDVQGSYEAIKEAIQHLGNDEVGVDIIAGGVGAITDSDVTMAMGANGYIIGFNMRPVTSARKMAEQNGVDVRTYSIIYKLIDEVTSALEGMLEPESIEKYIGRAEVKEVFSIPKVGTIAGCGVIDGKIERGCHIRLLRAGKILYDGKLSTLKRFKDEVKEVGNGYECGMALEGYDNIKNEDLIEAYQLETKARKLEVDQIV